MDLCWKDLNDEVAALDLKDCIDTLMSSIADHQTMVHEALARLKEKVQRLAVIDSDVAELKYSVHQLELKDSSIDEMLDLHEKRLTSLEKGTEGKYLMSCNLHSYFCNLQI